MRIYLPASARDLVDPVGVGPRTGHGVTTQLVSSLGEADPEEYEYHAYQLSVEDCLAWLAAVGDLPVRIVLAADVPEAQVSTVPATMEADPSAIEVTTSVPWEDVVAIFVDDPAAAATVREVLAGRLGDEGALDEWDLMWFDPAEREAVAASVMG